MRALNFGDDFVSSRHFLALEYTPADVYPRYSFLNACIYTRLREMAMITLQLGFTQSQERGVLFDDSNKH